ncbi:unnamed protein product [Pleuronectes platessa]|uniref:Secreted protein n=1 Tax=Pleuronectes platessa TaxID=8262 RepID=A0A9N7TPF4_PLEPL|nr:unnamed protein product [Pleuronectes platessa]
MPAVSSFCLLLRLVPFNAPQQQLLCSASSQNKHSFVCSVTSAPESTSASSTSVSLGSQERAMSSRYTAPFRAHGKLTTKDGSSGHCLVSLWRNEWQVSHTP